MLRAALVAADRAQTPLESGGPPTEDDVQQAARLLRLWAGDRQRSAGQWTPQEQAAIELAIRLEVATPRPQEPT